MGHLKFSHIHLLIAETNKCAYKGDGNCDDDHNNADCEWDGGDCCGSNVKTTYCYLCACLDPNFDCIDKCGIPLYKG